MLFKRCSWQPLASWSPSYYRTSVEQACLVCVIGEGLYAGSWLQVPQLDLWIAGAGNEGIAAWMAAHTENPGCMPCEFIDLSSPHYHTEALERLLFHGRQGVNCTLVIKVKLADPRCILDWSCENHGVRGACQARSHSGTRIWTNSREKKPDLRRLLWGNHLQHHIGECAYHRIQSEAY